MPPVRAAHLHLARLEGLDETADVFTVLRHTEGAATLVPPHRLATAQVDAGIEAYRRRALPEAVALFEAALPAASPADRPRLLAHRALCLEATVGTDAADALDDALAAALTAGDSDLAVSVAIGDEPLGLSLQGDRLARLRNLLDRPVEPRRRLDLLAGTIREAEATAQDGAHDLLAEARELADAIARDDPETRARVRTLEARGLADVAHSAVDRLAVASDAHRLALATGDPTLRLDTTEVLMTCELAVGHSARARELREEFESTAERWFRPRSIWAAQVTD